LRILILTWEYPPRIIGGLSRHVYNLAHALAKKGVEIHILTCSDFGNTRIEKDGEIFVHRIKPLYLPGENFLLWVNHFNMAIIEHAIKLNNDQEFDIIHAHDWITAFAGRILKHSYYIPLITTIHATESGRNNGIHNETQNYISSIEWWLTYESWRVICCSKYMEEELRFLFNIPIDKLRIIPNGIQVNDLKNTDKSFNRRQYASDDEKIVFFIGRNVEEKGIHILLKAIPLVVSRFPNVKFVIAGTGPKHDQLKALAQQIGILQKTCFVGYIDDRKRNSFFENSQIAVFPSLYEPFGIVALEAMACKLPVIVGDTGGFKEIVRHEIDGIRVTPGSEKELANAILDLLFDPSKSEKIGNNGYKNAVENYSWDKIADKTINVYREVLYEYENSSWQMEKYNIKYPLVTY